MNHPAKILFRSFVQPFYRENAPAFAFVFTMMFYIVNKVDGAGLFEYHRSLVIGMLKSNSFLLIVFFIWFLYARKCAAFVNTLLRSPEYAFLHVYNSLGKTKRFRLFVIIEVMLLLPVLLYAVFIIITGLQEHYYFPVAVVVAYLVLASVIMGVWHVHLLHDPHKTYAIFSKKLKLWPALTTSYPGVLLRFIAAGQKIACVCIKAFTCSILYLTARNNTPADYDISFPFLFFNFGLLANALIIYRTREFEETYLSFYRGLPVSLIQRYLHYGFFYFLLLLPEFITIAMLAPVFLQYTDAINFALCSYSLLLLLNNVTFLQSFTRREYAVVLFIIFGIQYIFLLMAGLTALYLLLFIAGILFFIKGYYKFERIMQRLNQ